ncbi:MAG: hypothetical protein M3P01_06800 [Actinomycetota bacterium]|nr:hypothetical protein [Actinomycetota bacterium]
MPTSSAPAPQTTSSQTGKSGAQSQAPVPAESNPPGDIPDSTAFVPYASSPGHFRITVPEGWARRMTASEVIFTSKLNQVAARWSSRPTSAPAEIRALQRTAPAFQLEKTSQVTLPGGRATLIQYQMNSKPNAVTGQQYRLVILQFDFLRGAREVSLILSSPVGADNVDPWRTVSESFRWR